MAFASRVSKSELSDEEVETEYFGLRSKRFPVISCGVAKLIVCIGGVAAIGTRILKIVPSGEQRRFLWCRIDLKSSRVCLSGAFALRLTRDALRKRRRSRLGAPGPSTPFTRLLGSVLLSNTTEQSSDTGFLSRLAGGPKEAATAEVLGEPESVTALYFTGKGVEQILEVGLDTLLLESLQSALGQPTAAL